MPSLSGTIVTPARRIEGRLRVPGDKSISHRYALIAAVAEGTSHLLNYSPGADCRSTLSCLQRLSIDIRRDHEDAVTVLGRGFGCWRSSADPLDAGNSGS